MLLQTEGSAALANIDTSFSLSEADLAVLRTRLATRQDGVLRLQQPVAIIGPGDASAQECAAARQIAAALAAARVGVICGGRGGVMEAAAQGAAQAGGLAIGLLPEEDARHANAYLSMAVPTGMGELRNGIIARSALFLVAIGGSMGTLSEIALGLRMGKRVFSLDSEWHVPGMTVCADIDELEARALSLLWEMGRDA